MATQNDYFGKSVESESSLNSTVVSDVSFDVRVEVKDPLIYDCFESKEDEKIEFDPMFLDESVILCSSVPMVNIEKDSSEVNILINDEDIDFLNGFTRVSVREQFLRNSRLKILTVFIVWLLI